jgi:hypothetical protein
VDDYVVMDTSVNSDEQVKSGDVDAFHVGRCEIIWDIGNFLLVSLGNMMQQGAEMEF